MRSLRLYHPMVFYGHRRKIKRLTRHSAYVARGWGTVLAIREKYYLVLDRQDQPRQENILMYRTSQTTNVVLHKENWSGVLQTSDTVFANAIFLRGVGQICNYSPSPSHHPSPTKFHQLNHSHSHILLQNGPFRDYQPSPSGGGGRPLWYQLHFLLNTLGRTRPEAEFLDVIGTKVFLLLFIVQSPLRTDFTPPSPEQKWFETCL